MGFGKLVLTILSSIVSQYLVFSGEIGGDINEICQLSKSVTLLIQYFSKDQCIIIVMLTPSIKQTNGFFYVTEQNVH